jgi:hypothetical protein
MYQFELISTKGKIKKCYYITVGYYKTLYLYIVNSEHYLAS